MPFAGMWRSEELGGIFYTKATLAGGLVKQRQVRNLLAGSGREGGRPGRRGRRLGLTRSPRLRETTITRKRACTPRHVRRGMAGTGARLGERWGIRLVELIV